MTDPDGARGIVPSGTRGKRYAEISSWPEAAHHLHSGRHFPVFTGIKRQANPSRLRLPILDTLDKKIPSGLRLGLTIPSLRWIREGQMLPAGALKQRVQNRDFQRACLLRVLAICVTVCGIQRRTQRPLFKRSYIRFGSN
jgi:hypothetical protein